MTHLQFLKGLVASEVKTIHDYTQIIFSDGTTLTIFSNYALKGGSVADIEGMEVQTIEESNDSLVIVFDDGKSIVVSLKDDDYNGPEAMVLNQEGRPTVVWN